MSNILEINVLKKNDIKYRVCENFPKDNVRFIDLTPSIIDARCRASIILKYAKYIKEYARENSIKIDAIISPDARGFIWGMGVATKMSLPLIPVRKTGKLPANCISETVSYDTEYSTTSLDLPITNLKNKNIVFIDDVYATGGTYKACKELVEKAGGNISRCLVIYDVGIDENNEVYSLVRGGL